MTWYTFQDWVWTSGPRRGQLKVYNLTGIDNLELEATGAHGYPTEQDALQKPNAFPSVAQEALLAGFSVQAAFPIGGGTAGAQKPTPPAGGGVSVPGLTTLPQFLDKLNQRQTWVRIAEGTLGIALILVALAHITGAGKVTNLPRTVIKGVRKGTAS